MNNALVTCLLALVLLLGGPVSTFSQPLDTIVQHYQPSIAPKASETEVQFTLVVLDLKNRGVPELPVWLESSALGKVWHGMTDRNGEVVFLLPRGKAFTVHAADEADLDAFRTVDAAHVQSRLAVGYTPKIYTETVRNDTVFQEVPDSQLPIRSRMLTWLTVVGFDGLPHQEEQLYFLSQNSGLVYAARTNTKGRANLMLPKGDSLVMHTLCEEDITRLYFPADGRTGKLQLQYTTIGSEAILARRAERARLAAVRDSLYRIERMRDSLEAERALAEEEDFLHMLTFGADAEKVVGKIQSRAEKERALVEADARYFEKAGQEVQAALYRKRLEWSHKVIVTDITGSMYPYMDQVLLWHALALIPGEQNRYLFFNDGNQKPEEEKKIGAAGGLYYTQEMAMEQLLNTMGQAMENGHGGDSPENDLEALLEGVRHMGEMDELILIADNYSDVRDIDLLLHLQAPVRIVLAGTEHGINEDYLKIAYHTGGSIHTLEADIEHLAQLADGEILHIGAYSYQVSRGTFLQLKE